MKSLFFASLTVAVLLAGDDAAIKKDRKAYEGTWRVVALEVDGNKTNEENARKISVVNNADGTWVLVRDGEEISKGDSQIDPTKTPKTIDFTPTSGSGSGKDFVGIYELGANTRKLCFGEKNNGRPTDFATQAGSGHVFVTFEREKK